MIKIVYTAGPYRAPTPEGVRRNVERAKWWADAVWRLGAAAICPHLNTYDLDQACAEGEFIERDLEIVRRCDAVLALPGWEKSAGAKAEVACAHDLGLPVFYWYGIGELDVWLRRAMVA